MSVLVLGAGFSGKAIGARLVDLGHQVIGTTRQETGFGSIRACGIEPLLFDGQNASEPLLKSLRETTHLIVSIAPSRIESENADDVVDPSLAAFGDLAANERAPNLQWIGYLSTVGVYGNHDGAWVDETTTIAPQSARSRQRVRAEAEWLAVGEALGLPVGTFRLSGIYGPGRNAFVTIERGKSRRLVKKDQVFNRIHVGDIARFVSKALELKADGLFNITDNEPAPPQDVVTFAHELMGREPPPEFDFETANLTPMARSFYGENKRVSNQKSKEILGLDYDWADYRSSFQRMWNDGSWR